MHSGHNVRRFDLVTIAVVLVFLTAMVLAAWLSDTDEVLAALERLGGCTLALVLGLSLANYGLRAIRWWLLSEHFRLAIPPYQSMRIFLAGLAMGATPARAGEAIRLWMMRRQFGVHYRTGAALMLADRVSDVNALALLAASGASVWFDRPMVLVSAVSLLALANLVAARPAKLIALIGALFRFTRPGFGRTFGGVEANAAPYSDDLPNTRAGGLGFAWMPSVGGRGCGLRFRP